MKHLLSYFIIFLAVFQMQAQQSRTKDFYNTYGIGSNGGFWIVGNGLQNQCLKLRITNSQITLSGSATPYQNNMIYYYKGKNKDGSLRYQGVTNIGFGVKHINDINLSSDHSRFTLVTYSGTQWTTSTLFVSSVNERDRLIKDNLRNYQAGAQMPYTNSSNQNNNSDWRDNLRYPEYQRYNDKRGNFDNRKYQSTQQTKCRVCGGTGINPYPDTSPAGSRIARYHDGKGKCSICGKYYKHHHDKCASCN